MAKINDPETFFENLQSAAVHDLNFIIEQNSAPFRKLMSYYQCAIYEIETKFKVLNEEFSLTHDRNPIENIKTRLKSMESITEKMARKNIPISVENIEKNLNDVAGVRVVCTFIEDIYRLADCLTDQDDITLIARKDYIENPKPGGYRSLHLIVEVPIFLEKEKRPMRVEVQLRTISQNFWASLEHQLRYKKDIPEDEKNSIAAELRACADENASLDLRMQDVRRRIEAFKVEEKPVESELLKVLGLPHGLNIPGLNTDIINGLQPRF